MDIGYASIAMSLASGYASRATASAQAKVNKAQADAANLVRQGDNIQKAAEGSLARWMQAENNNRRLKAAGEQLAAGTQTLLRQRDLNITGSIEQQLAEAEAAGAYAANSAFSGVAGNAVDMIDMTMRLRNSRATAAKEQQQGFVDYDTLTQLTGIMPQTAAGLDRRTISDGLDYSTNLSYEPPQGNAFFDILMSPGLGSVLQSLGPAGSAGNPISGLKTGKQATGFKMPKTTSSSYTLY